MKLSGALVVRNEEASLKQALDSIAPICDDIVVVDTGSEDRTVEIAKEYGRVIQTTEFNHEEWEGFIHFSDARNFAAEQCSNDHYIWIDGDDILYGQDAVKLLFPAVFERIKFLGAVFFPYLYEYDQDGRLTCIQLRERILDRTLSRWHGEVHETPAYATEYVQTVQTGDEFPEIKVDHANRNRDITKSAWRNYVILKDVCENKGSKNPRQWMYLGQSAYGLRRWREANTAYDFAIAHSGMPLDIAECWRRKAICWFNMGYYRRAIRCTHEADLVEPVRTNQFIAALVCARMGYWEECLRYTEIGLNSPKPTALLGYDPMGLEFRPYMQAFTAAMNLKRYDDAVEAIEKAMGAIQDPPEDLQERRDAARRMAIKEQTDKVFHAAEQILAGMGHDGAPRIKALNYGLPNKLRIRPQEFFDEAYPENEIVIYCGDSQGTIWGPATEYMGCGGSEEMVINLARGLAKTGRPVYVYNECGGHAGQDPDADGLLTYLPHDAYNPNVKRGTLIVWRRPDLLVKGRPHARQVYLWEHDIIDDWFFRHAKIHENLDAVICMSHWQRGVWPSLPDDKVFVSRNGIRLEDFGSSVPRNPKRAIFASQAIRGLEVLLRNWREIHERTGGELVICYGFMAWWWKFARSHKYEWDCHTGSHVRMDDWREHILDLYHEVRDCKVHWLGNVGHPWLEREFERSGVWLYPNIFPEISCITAMRAQAAGAVPVTTNFAALDETVQFGFKAQVAAEGDMNWERPWVEAAVEWLNSEEKQSEIRTPMMDWAKAAYGLEALANQWTRFMEKKDQAPRLVSVA